MLHEDGPEVDRQDTGLETLGRQPMSLMGIICDEFSSRCVALRPKKYVVRRGNASESRIYRSFGAAAGPD